MKNKISFIFSVLAVLTLTFCANPDDDVEHNCLNDDDFGDYCGLFPIPSDNDEPINFCMEVQTLVDQAENANQNLDDDENISIDDRGNHPVVAAPHGAADLGTSDIVNQVGDNLSINSIRFFRFRTLLNANVNRPTNQAASAAQEEWDYDAASVYHCYRNHVLDFFEGKNNSFYIEIHGNEREESAQRLEVVCSDDITNMQDALIEDIFQQEITNEYGRNTLFNAYTLNQTPDSIYFTASATRSCGLFCSLQDENIPAIHVEVPAAYRGSFNSQARNKLINMLTNAIERIDNEVL